jgi:hypothetical protein
MMPDTSPSFQFWKLRYAGIAFVFKSGCGEDTVPLDNLGRLMRKYYVLFLIFRISIYVYRTSGLGSLE